MKLFAFIFWLLCLNQNFTEAIANTSCDSSTCQQCQTQNGQVSCSTCINSSYKILQNGCVQACPSYTQEVNGICKQICYQSCGSCSGSDYFQCQTCRDNRQLEQSFFFQYGECKCKYSFTDDLTPTCQDSSMSSIFNTIIFSLALVSLIAIILLSLIKWSGFILYYYLDSLQCAALLYYVNYSNGYQLDDLLKYLDKSNISSTIKPDWYRGESNYNTSYTNWKVSRHINSSNFGVEQIIIFIFTLILWLIAFFSIKYYQMRNVENKKGINNDNNISIRKRSDKLNHIQAQKNNSQLNKRVLNSANSSLNVSVQQRSLSQIQEELGEDDQTKNIKKKQLQQESQRDINDISSRNSRNNLFKKQSGGLSDRNNQSQLNSNRINQNNSNFKYLAPPQKKFTFNQSKSSLNSIIIYDSNEPNNFRFSKGMQNRDTNDGNKISQRSSQANDNKNNQQQNNNKNLKSSLNLPEYQSQYQRNSQISQKKQIKAESNKHNISKEIISNKNPFSISIIIFFFMITIQETLIVIFGQFNYSFTFQNPGTTASTGFCLLMIIYIFGFLFYLFRKLFKNKIRQNQDLQSDYNVLFYIVDNYNQDRIYQRCYFAFSFCRKLISSIACTLLHKSPLAQIIVLLCNQAVYIIYIMSCSPIRNNQEKYLIFLAHSEVLICFLFQTIIVSKDESSQLEVQSINKYTEGLIYIIIILLFTFILYSFYILIQWLILKCRQCASSQKKKREINKKDKQQIFPEKVLVPVEVPVELEKEKINIEENDNELKKKVDDLQKELQDVKARQDSIDKLQIIEVKEEADNSIYDGKLILYGESNQNTRLIQDESFRDDFDEKRKLLKSQSIQVNSNMLESGQQSTILPPSSEKKKRFIQSRQTQVNMDQENFDYSLNKTINSDYQKQSIVYESVIQEKTEEDSEIKKNKIYNTQQLQVDSTCFEKPKVFAEAQVQTQNIPTPKKFKDQAIGNSEVFGAEEEQEIEKVIQFYKQPIQRDFSSQTLPIEIQSPRNQKVEQQSVLNKIIQEIQDQDIPKLTQKQKQTNDAGSQYTLPEELSERQNHPLSQTSIQHTTILDKANLDSNSEYQRFDKTPIVTQFIKAQTPQKQQNYTHQKINQHKGNNGLKWGETNKFDKYCNGKEMHSKIQNQRSRISSLNHTISSHDKLSINPNIYLGPTTPQHSRNNQISFKEIEQPNSARSNYNNNNDTYRYGNIFSRGAQNSLQTIQLDQPSAMMRNNNTKFNRTPSQNQEQSFQKYDEGKRHMNNYLSNQSPSQSRSTERSRSNNLNLQQIPKSFDLNSKIIL